MSSSEHLQPRQVDALPIGTGNNNATKKELNDIHTQLTLMRAQATADQLYDPPPPTPLTKAQIKEAYCGMHILPLWMPRLVGLAGVACILYGVVAKK